MNTEKQKRKINPKQVRKMLRIGFSKKLAAKRLRVSEKSIQRMSVNITPDRSMDLLIEHGLEPAIWATYYGNEYSCGQIGYCFGVSRQTVFKGLTKYYNTELNKLACEMRMQSKYSSYFEKLEEKKRALERLRNLKNNQDEVRL